MRSTPLLAALMILALSATPASAQNAVLDDLYGQGVHAYFDGQLDRSLDLLNQAIGAGSQDPRAFYFRGLVQLRMGLEEEARADFAAGAQLETKDSPRFYAVSRALARVQGPARRLLERYRTDARAHAYLERERLRALRYEELRDAEDEVLMPPPRRDATPARPTPDAGRPAAEEPLDADPFSAPAQPPAPAGTDPFGEAEPATPAPADQPEAEPAPDADADPFGFGDAAPADEAADDSPF